MNDFEYRSAPAQSALRYENVQLQNQFFDESPYKGKPTPELEKRWQDLWLCTEITHYSSFFFFLYLLAPLLTKPNFCSRGL